MENTIYIRTKTEGETTWLTFYPQHEDLLYLNIQANRKGFHIRGEVLHDEKGYACGLKVERETAVASFGEKEEVLRVVVSCGDNSLLLLCNTFADVTVIPQFEGYASLDIYSGDEHLRVSYDYLYRSIVVDGSLRPLVKLLKGILP